MVRTIRGDRRAEGFGEMGHAGEETHEHEKGFCAYRFKKRMEEVEAVFRQPKI